MCTKFSEYYTTIDQDISQSLVFYFIVDTVYFKNILGQQRPKIIPKLPHMTKDAWQQIYNLRVAFEIIYIATSHRFKGIQIEHMRNRRSTLGCGGQSL